jgi:DNA primase
MRGWVSLRPSDSRKNWLGKLAQRYHESLTEEVRSYLASRGLDQDAVNGSLLGLVTEPDPAHEQYRGRLSIPFLTPTGVVYMRFRCLEDHECKEFKHGKYEGASGEDVRLFNVSSLHGSGSIVGIAEGELDALVATHSGLPSVGVPGANNWKPFYYRLFQDYERVIVMGDGDKAGRAFVATLTQNIPAAVPRPMPQDHDVTSYVVENGADEFMRYVTE